MAVSEFLPNSQNILGTLIWKEGESNRQQHSHSVHQLVPLDPRTQYNGILSEIKSDLHK